MLHISIILGIEIQTLILQMHQSPSIFIITSFIMIYAKKYKQFQNQHRKKKLKFLESA